ncbi:MAG: homoserine dehydrogenase, partial [Acidimicrobiales bacterium]
MSEMRLAIAGFGNIGRTLAAESPGISARIGMDVTIVAVSDPRYGTIVDPKGIDGALLAKAAANDGSFSGFAGHVADVNTMEMIEAAPADVLVELTYTDLATGEPALSHIEAAIARGMDVSTTNKGPIALRLVELEGAATAAGVTIAFEGTVMSGTPAVAVARDTVGPAGFKSAVGILNGTTNFMLGRIEDGLGFDAALAQAQELGYAEADPSGDIDGHDAAAKLAILAGVLTGRPLPLDRVDTTSLSSIDETAVRAVR